MPGGQRRSGDRRASRSAGPARRVARRAPERDRRHMALDVRQYLRCGPARSRCPAPRPSRAGGAAPARTPPPGGSPPVSPRPAEPAWSSPAGPLGPSRPGHLRWSGFWPYTHWNCRIAASSRSVARYTYPRKYSASVCTRWLITDPAACRRIISASSHCSVCASTTRRSNASAPMCPSPGISVKPAIAARKSRACCAMQATTKSFRSRSIRCSAHVVARSVSPSVTSRSALGVPQLVGRLQRLVEPPARGEGRAEPAPVRVPLLAEPLDAGEHPGQRLVLVPPDACTPSQPSVILASSSTALRNDSALPASPASRRARLPSRTRAAPGTLDPQTVHAAVPAERPTAETYPSS